MYSTYDYNISTIREEKARRAYLISKCNNVVPYKNHETDETHVLIQGTKIR